MKRSRISFNPHPGQRVIDFGFSDLDEAAATHGEKTTDREVTEPAPVPLKFISLGSGSSGNCSFIGYDKGGVLIDAGVRADFVETTLRDNGIPMSEVKGIVLTHDHSDHIQYVYRLLRAHRHMRLFCTNRVMTGLLRRHNVTKRIKEYHSAVYKEIPFSVLDMKITAFEVPHDGSDNMGFSITVADRNFVFATDMGAVSERALHYIRQAHYLVVEANYDLEMLLNGRYPDYLKARIQTRYGHMDNALTGKLLAEVAGNGLKYVFLCHLSKDNNTPEKAVSTVRKTLTDAGYIVGTDAETRADMDSDLILTALPRFDATRLYVLR